MKHHYKVVVFEAIGVVLKPFGFEGKKHMHIAELGIEKLKKYVDSLMIISNDKPLSVSDETTSFLDAFKMSDSVLKDGIEAIASILSKSVISTSISPISEP
jgi:cell division protein FtsZ